MGKTRPNATRKAWANAKKQRNLQEWMDMESAKNDLAAVNKKRRIIEQGAATIAERDLVLHLAKIKRAITEGGIYSGLAHELTKYSYLMDKVDTEVDRQRDIEAEERNRRQILFSPHPQSASSITAQPPLATSTGGRKRRQNLTRRKRHRRR
jgi:hypothetical protein